MLSKVKRSLVLTLAGLAITGALGLVSGCTVAIEGVGDFADYVVHVFDDCDYCGYDVVEIEYDD